MLFSFSYAERH